MNNKEDTTKKVKAAACLTNIYFSIKDYQYQNKININTIPTLLKCVTSVTSVICVTKHLAVISSVISSILKELKEAE